MTEEMEDTQLAAAAWDYDRRAWTTVVGVAYAESPCDVGQIFGVYRPVQVARYQADYALNVVKGFADADVADKATLVQTAALYAGYSYILLGEGFCTSAVSAPTEILTADGGAELSSADLFAAAEARFTEAIAGPDATLANAARVGRARARLNLAKPVGGAPNAAKLAEARADAVAVPAGFNYTVPYNAATSYSQNLLFRRQKDFLLYGVAPPYRDLTFAGVKDPRTAVTNTGLAGRGRGLDRLVGRQVRQPVRPDLARQVPGGPAYHRGDRRRVGGRRHHQRAARRSGPAALRQQ
jgi:hypothetical protein